MVRRLTPSEIQAILNKGTFEELIGVVEDEHLECKSAPYQLAHDHQKQELAKDVSALANKSGRLGADGGYILIGPQTGQSPEHHGDIVESVSVFHEALVSIPHYHAVLESWLLAVPEDIVIRWYPSADDPLKGIIAIAVPKQRPELWPFLITRTVDAAGKITGTLVGYFERRRDGAAPLPIGELQRLLRDGRRFDAVVPPLLETIQALQAASTSPAPKKTSTALENYRQRRGEAVAAAGLNGKPTFALTAAPLRPTTLPTLFRGASDPLVRLLENPPELRVHGFDLNAGGSSEIVKGQLRRAVIPERLLFECWPDGTLIFVADGVDFLCWGKTTALGAVRINPLALAESTYLFTTLAKTIYDQHAQPPVSSDGVECSLTLYKMERDGKRAILTAGSLKSWGYLHTMHPKEAPEPTGEFIERLEGDWTSGELAYCLVARVYTWFGLTEEDIPYFEEVAGRRTITAAKIKAADSP
jgi:hypothetical protein